MDPIDKALDDISRLMFGMPFVQTWGMLSTGDYDALDAAIATHSALLARQDEARRRARERNVERVRTEAETVGGRYKLLTIPGKVGRGRSARRVPLYITGVSFGSGWTVKRYEWSAVRSEAHQFSAVGAAEIAAAMSKNGVLVSVVASD